MDSSAPFGIGTWIALIVTPLVVGFGGTFVFLYYANPKNAPAENLIIEPIVSASEELVTAEPALAASFGISSEMEAEQGTSSMLFAAVGSSTVTDKSTSTAAATTTAPAAKKLVQNEPKKLVEPKPVIIVAEPKSEPVKVETGFKLAVPYYKQQYTNSCEAASLRMALAFKGVFKNDMELIIAMGYQPRPRDLVNNIWDDPQEMYVGEVDVVDITKGYGVYGKPVARASRTYGRSADFMMTMTPAALAGEIKNGNPVIMWGYTTLGAPYTWTTPMGKTATAFRGEHARVVVGYEGDASNPTGFYVHDPINGREFELWTTDSLMAQFNAVPEVTNQAVVVR